MNRIKENITSFLLCSKTEKNIKKNFQKSVDKMKTVQYNTTRYKVSDIIKYIEK